MAIDCDNGGDRGVTTGRIEKTIQRATEIN
jgi:hypothetical protein